MTTEGVAETRIYSGEVWTDARGLAVVLLPEHVDALPSAFEYELMPEAPGVRASVAQKLRDHRFTIETDEPHAKVSWRVTAYRAEGDESRRR